MLDDRETLSFGAKHRLKSAVDFRSVYRQRQFVRNRSMTLYYLHRDDDHSRLGLSVGRRHGTAVKRNRIKRVLREVYRLNRALIPGAFDFILIPSFHADIEDFQLMRKSFVHLLKKLEAQVEAASS